MISGSGFRVRRRGVNADALTKSSRRMVEKPAVVVEDKPLCVKRISGQDGRLRVSRSAEPLIDSSISSEAPHGSSASS